MPESAVHRYKQLAERNTEAVRRMREHDRARAEVLREAVTRSQQALALAGERERVARMGVRLHWEAAIEELWNERWLTVQPVPAPIQPAPGDDSLRCDAEVGRTYEALRAALRRPSVLLRRVGRDGRD